MNPANATSTSSSGTTSSGARSTPGPETPGVATGSATPSESEYLKQQAAAAAKAIADALSDLKLDLARGADPRRLVKAHPWITLASAAVAGFAAAATAVPSKEEQALRKLEAIERAVHRAHEQKEGANGKDGHGAKEHGGILALIVRELVGALKPVLIGVLTSHLTPQAPPTEQPAPGDPSGG